MSRPTIFRCWESRYSAAVPSTSRTAPSTHTIILNQALAERCFLLKTFWARRFNFTPTERL